MIGQLPRLSILAVMIFVASPAGAADLRAMLETIGPARVAEAVDGDTVALEGGGQARLAGIEAPKPTPSRGRADRSPLPGEAKAALAALVRGREVMLMAASDRHADRHGRVLAQVFVDERWVQGEMIASGMARVHTTPDTRALAAEMLALEDTARKQGRGLWANAAFGLRGTDDLERHAGTFQVIEATVVTAAKVKGRVYLNFGPDWRTDFTVEVPPATTRAWKKQRVDPLQWSGRRLRVRGWLDRHNGPSIELTHPEQVEVVAE